MPGPTTYAAERGESDNTPTAKSPDQKLLDKIRRRFKYMVDAWKDIRDQAELDMKAQSVDGPWTETDREERRENKRPCIHLDQLGQHTNGLVNEVRLNPIGIKASPGEDGTDDDTAELTENRIRRIEYESNGPQATLRAFEDAATRSYGVFGLQVVYKDWDSREQVAKFRRFPNPDAVLWDPDCKELDCSDMQDAFVLDRVLKDEFPEKFPDATITSFGEEVIAQAPHWFDDNTVQIAEYWYIEKTRKRIFWIQGKDGEEIKIFADQLNKGWKVSDDTLTTSGGVELPLLDDRTTFEPVVKQCLTNGVEILDRTEWLGKWIPVYPVIGKEKFIRDGNTHKRVLESYIRMARDGQMLFDYLVSSEAEVVGMTPKTPYVGYVGQFETDMDAWKTLNKVPRAFVQVDPVADATGQAVLPLPQRQVFEPPIQALNIGKESARRSIQSAVGSYGFTRLDDTNVKSGKAVQELDRQSDMGSYHFIDNYKVTLAHAYRSLDDLLPKLEKRNQRVGLAKADGSHEVVTLGEQYEGKDGQPRTRQYRTGEDARNHDIRIATGKAYQSQREEASEFADSLAKNPNVFPIIGDLVVKLKDLGPVGDEIVARLKKMLPPQLQENDGQGPPPEQQLAQMQQQMQHYEQALNDAMQQLDEFKSKKFEIDAQLQMKQMELESRERMQAYSDDVKLGIAELTAKQKMAAEDLSVFMLKMDHTLQMIQQQQDHAHEAAMGHADSVMAAQQQRMQQLHEQQQQETDQLGQQQMQQQDHAQQQNLQQQQLSAQPAAAPEASPQ